ncbi:MAG: hypothetical protein EOP45_17620, partial [Sphingobacteriaceae bacterium]
MLVLLPPEIIAKILCNLQRNAYFRTLRAISIHKQKLRQVLAFRPRPQEIHYEERQRQGGYVLLDSRGGGYEPLDDEFIYDATIKEVALMGDRFFVFNNLHVGSNGWPTSMEILDLGRCCNLDVKELKHDNLKQLILPFNSYTFGSNLDGVWVKYYERDNHWDISYANDEEVDSLPFLPSLQKIVFQASNRCCTSDMLEQMADWNDLNMNGNRLK